MKRIAVALLALVLWLVAMPSFASFSVTQFIFGTASSKPLCNSSRDGVAYWFSDGTTAVCTAVSGGSNVVLCGCDGATNTWVELGSGGGGGSPHDLLDATQNQDTTASAATRGDMLVANSSALWDDVAIGASGKYWRSDGTDPSWQYVAYADVTGTPTLYQYRVYNTTTNATPTELFTNGTSTQLSMPANKTWTMDCVISAYRSDTTGGRASYRLEKGFYKDSTAGSLAPVASQVKTVFGESDAAWDVALLADTTNGNPYVQVTGEGSKTIKWSAVCTISETP